MAFNQNIERKKWIIARIKYMIIIYREELNSQRLRFNNFVQNQISGYQNWMNSLLAGMGIVVTVATLVVGIRAFNGIEYKIYAELIISLIVIVIALVIVLLIMIMFKRITLSFLNKIDDSFLEVFQREDMLNGFLAEKTFYINSLTIPQLYAISRFIILLHGHRFDLSATHMRKRLNY